MPMIDNLLNELATCTVDEDSLNLYSAGDNPFHAIRRANLGRYLAEMQAREVKTLLLMEAPGYRGCRLTGIPVTSRKIMLEGVAELDLFGQNRGYQDAQELGFEDIYSEQSATIVWQTLAALHHTPLIWNSYPFHPHQVGNPRTNRKPRQSEINRLGKPFLAAILELFQPERCIAVGNVAEALFASIGQRADKVRHPAQGGKNDFVAGLTALLGDKGE